MPTIQTGGRKWKSNYPHDKEVLDLIREKAWCHMLWVARQHGLEGLNARQSYNQARNQVRKRTRQLSCERVHRCLQLSLCSSSDIGGEGFFSTLLLPWS